MENSPPPYEKSPPSNVWTCEILEEKSPWILAKTFFFFFFGDHLIFGGKNVWILDFGRKITLIFGEDLFFLFFGDHLIFGGKNLWISDLSETFRLKISDKPSETDSRSMKIRVKVVCTLLTLSKQLPPFPNPGYAPDRDAVKRAKVLTFSQTTYVPVSFWLLLATRLASTNQNQKHSTFDSFSIPIV